MRVWSSLMRRLLRRFARDERGVLTVQNLLLTISCCAIGGLAMDVTHLYSARTELQVAADIGAHSAIFLRYQGKTAADARTGAIQMVESTLPRSSYGQVLDAADIVFGNVDASTGAFTALASGSTAMPTAVRVVTNRADDNPVESLFFRMVGLNRVNVRASAMYSAVGDPCSTMQGLFAQGTIPTNGLTEVSSGFCIHSNTAATFRNKVTFATGASVSMPNTANVSCSGTDWSKHCPGLDRALRSATYNLNQWLDPIRGPVSGTESSDDLLADVQAALPDWNWTGVSRGSIRTVTSRSLTPSTANLSGSVSYIDCGAGGGNVTLGTTGKNSSFSGTYSRVVLLMRNCNVTVDSDVTLVDTILYTTSQDAQSFKSAGGPNDSMVIGNDRDCDGVGAAALLTRGGLHTAAGLMLNGGIIRALGDVSFAAHFGGKDDSGKGVSIIAGGMIDPRSNNAFTACDPDPSDPPRLVSFRLAG